MEPYKSVCNQHVLALNLNKMLIEKIAKIQNISKTELNQAKKLQRKSIGELKEIARSRRIKNSEKLTKEDLIIALLKLESSATEQNFKKYFNNNNNVLLHTFVFL